MEIKLGRGFGEKNLRRMIRFAEAFPEEKIVSALLRQFGWTHFTMLLPTDNELKRGFYAEMCRIERWNTRTLEADCEWHRSPNRHPHRLPLLPPTSPLVEEALADAVTVDVDGIPARVFAAEHLAAVALQTGRAKDKACLLQFVEAGVLKAERFQAILARHGLVDRWREFERTFLRIIP